MTTRIISAAAIALTALGSSVAVASDLQPTQAGTFTLGDQTASVYYTADGDTYQVVTTIAPTAGTRGAPIRFTGSLQPGERQMVSVGQFGTHGRTRSLELVHEGGVLSARLVSSEMVAVQ